MYFPPLLAKKPTMSLCVSHRNADMIAAPPALPVPRGLPSATSMSAPVYVPLSVQFFCGVQLADFSTSPSVVIPLGLGLLLRDCRDAVGAAALLSVVAQLLGDQVTRVVAASVGGGLQGQVSRNSFSWVLLPQGAPRRGRGAPDQRCLAAAVASCLMGQVDAVRVVAVFRGRGGKGKAAFLARLERKGREYRRAVQMAARNARQAGQAVDGATATATRRTQAAALLTERVRPSEGRFRRTADQQQSRTVAPTDEAGLMRNLEDAARRDPSHPLSALRSKQERARVDMERLRSVARAAVAKGIQKAQRRGGSHPQ